jgi:hypothetical protein
LISKQIDESWSTEETNQIQALNRLLLKEDTAKKDVERTWQLHLDRFKGEHRDLKHQQENGFATNHTGANH